MIKKTLIIIFILVLSYVSIIYVGSNHSSKLSSVDEEFISLIEKTAEDANGVVKVTEINPGDWTKVCATSEWVYEDNMALNAIDISSKHFNSHISNDVKVTNNNHFILNTNYQQTAVFFVMSSRNGKASEISVYRSSPSFASYSSTGQLMFNCIDRDRAAFSFSTTENQKFIKLVSTESKPSARQIMGVGTVTPLYFQDCCDNFKEVSGVIGEIFNNQSSLEIIKFDFSADGHMDYLIRQKSGGTCKSEYCPTKLLSRTAEGMHFEKQGPLVSRDGIWAASGKSLMVFSGRHGECEWDWKLDHDQDFRCFKEKRLRNDGYKVE